MIVGHSPAAESDQPNEKTKKRRAKKPKVTIMDMQWSDIVFKLHGKPITGIVSIIYNHKD